jgi:class 3 adenylate cyclase/CheY-like chemotaxis protein
MRAAPGPPTPDTATVLIVDDSAESRKLLALRLAQQGHRVLQAAGGQEALRLAEQEPPALVLLDVLMPDLDGFEVCRRLRRLPALRAVPVLMLTALDGTDHIVRGLEAGADDFVSKPFQPAELAARVRSLLRVKALFDEVERQRTLLEAWSQELEARVQAQVDELSRLSRLKRFFSPALAARLVAEGGDAVLASHRSEVTVLMADLRGFTAFAERAAPERVMQCLSAFHARMGELVFAHGGTLERFTGDGLMVFFNDPDPQPDHSARALALARAMLDAAATLRDDWHRHDGPQGLAIGIARGPATLGAVGDESRIDYAAIGRATNLAARLVAEAPAGAVWLDSATVQALPQDRFLGLAPLALKGFAAPVPAWRLQP